MLDKSIVIIPSLNPDEKLITLVNTLQKAGIINIIIVDDGSVSYSKHHFKKAQSLGCIVLNHKVNMGKGQALKTAFKFITENFPEDSLAVCADADGQHLTVDIIACLKALKQNPENLVLGVRDFSSKQIPLRSRFGNKLTRRILRLFSGINISDTQTGLRALSPKLMKTFLNTKGERFEYETHMLLDTKKHNIKITEVKINTVYIDENKTSHFSPLKDSFRIYFVFLIFLFSSGLCFIVDISVFYIINYFLKTILTQYASIILATIFARVLSSLLNFIINKNTVFDIKDNNKSDNKRMFFRYYALAILLMLLSAGFVNVVFAFLKLNEVISKLIVDIILFVLSYNAQKNWVFKSSQS